MHVLELFRPRVERMEVKGDVDGLIRALDYKRDWDVRKRAAEALGRMGDKKALESLIHAMKDARPLVRQAAATALGRMGDKKALESLIPHLRDAHRSVRAVAATALRAIGWQPKDEMEKAFYFIANGEWEELQKLGRPSVEPLVQALEDADWDVRKRAAETLGKIGDKRAVEPLVQALRTLDTAQVWMATMMQAPGWQPLERDLVWDLSKEECLDVRQTMKEALDRLEKGT